MAHPKRICPSSEPGRRFWSEGIMRSVVLVLAVGVLLAACGGGGGEKAAQSPTASPSPSIRVATTSQVASIVSKSRGDMRAQLDKAERCSSMDACEQLDFLSYETLRLQSSTLALGLENGDDPSTGLFIGVYPQELQALVERTIQDARASEAALEAFFDADCTTTAPDSCESLNLDVQLKIRALESTLNAWEPYL